MKVLFVASGNSKNHDIVPFIKAQGESLRQAGIEVSYFPVIGKGWKGYVKSAKLLHQYLQNHPVDIIHAHYTLCGWTAVLARPRQPIVLSLMGTDAYGEYIAPKKVQLRSRYLTLLTWLIQPFVQQIIAKSVNIERFIYKKSNKHIIPNGVRLEQFKIYDKSCCNELGLDPAKKYVLFLGNGKEKRKNFALAQEAVRLLNRPDVILINPYPIPHDIVVKYLNAVDVFVLCSYMEGSPNVIKEAMACNCPLVATDVGDAAWVIGDTPGCYVASFNPVAYGQKLAKALEHATQVGRTQGRQRILELGLDAENVAKKIITIYQKTLSTAYASAKQHPSTIESAADITVRD
ncbi:MAG: glycosyltransferase [Saprospiraceae bacterium]